ncbi:MAG: adenosylmethionine decarboxylase [Bacteroidota bacterium]
MLILLSAYIYSMEALGRHLLVELYECKPEILDDVIAVEQLMERAAKAAEATIINLTFHHFSPYGVSGVIVIQESHLAIHTWPESRYAAVDLFTCGSDTRPWEAFKVLKEGLKAKSNSAIEIQRGATALLPAPPNAQLPPNKQSSPSNPPAYKRDSWFTQRNEALALSLKHKGRRLLHTQSELQKIELYESIAYGKMLVLDGQIVLTEQDEYIYHEMITHLPLQILPEAQDILVIGGGDGGSMRELAKYPQLKSVHMIEIDAEVVALSRNHFPTWWEWENLDNFSWEVADAFEYVKTQTEASFDIIIVDLPQVQMEAEVFRAFYQRLYQMLRAKGLLIAPGHTPRYQGESFCEAVNILKGILGKDQVKPYLASIPTYPGGSWAFLAGEKGKIEKLSLGLEIPLGLKYYNKGVHQASFALPNDLLSLLSK